MLRNGVADIEGFFGSCGCLWKTFNETIHQSSRISCALNEDGFGYFILRVVWSIPALPAIADGPEPPQRLNGGATRHVRCGSSLRQTRITVRLVALLRLTSVSSSVARARAHEEDFTHHQSSSS